MESRKANPSQSTNSEGVLLPIGVFDGNSIGIGTESVNLRVAFVSGAVLQPDFEKQVLEFVERTAVRARREFFGDARRVRHAPRNEPRDDVRTSLEREIFPLRSDRRFEVADALIKLLQSEGLGRLYVPQGIHLRSIELRREDDLV